MASAIQLLQFFDGALFGVLPLYFTICALSSTTADEGSLTGKIREQHIVWLQYWIIWALIANAECFLFALMKDTLFYTSIRFLIHASLFVDRDARLDSAFRHYIHSGYECFIRFLNQ